MTMNCNTDLIMSRVLYLVGNSFIVFSTIFNYELAPVPTTMFQDFGEARYSKTIFKIVLKNKLKFEVTFGGYRLKCSLTMEKKCFTLLCTEDG